MGGAGLKHLFLTLLASGFGLAGLSAATLPAGFSETALATNLSAATAMAIAPDGRIFVCEQAGTLRVIKNDVLLATPFVSLTVNSTGERGLLGVAFDPNFATNKYVYLYYTTSTLPVHNRVSRFTANGDVAAAGSETVIVDLDNLSGATNHNGGAIHFGHDGKLYIAVGDNAASTNSQTLANRHGKMLRLNADGTIPTDNPFYNTATGANRAIWALGLRNPYTFTFQQTTGRMFINDVGASSFEEINDGIAGSNYGWPDEEGPPSGAPNPDYRYPLFSYGHGNGTTAGRAITGGAFYNPVTPQFPDSYLGKYFFADFVNDWIRLLDPATNTATLFATSANGPVDLHVGQVGSLYYLSRGNNNLMRVRYSPQPAAALNISVRAHIGTGDNVLIGGFIVAGDAYKRIVARGIGPSLDGFVTGPLADPFLELRDANGTLLQSNDNWMTSPDAAEIQTLALEPDHDLESALAATLTPGSYTAIVRGTSDGTGVGLVEGYDVSPGAEARLANISGRSLVQTGDNVMIAGFILGSGTEAASVVVRGLGPSTGLGGALADPVLELRDGNGVFIAANDNWQDDAGQAAALTAAGLAPANAAEAAIIVDRGPGQYTAILRGKNDTTGLGLGRILHHPVANGRLPVSGRRLGRFLVRLRLGRAFFETFLGLAEQVDPLACLLDLHHQLPHFPLAG